MSASISNNCANPKCGHLKENHKKIRVEDIGSPCWEDLDCLCGKFRKGKKEE